MSTEPQVIITMEEWEELKAKKTIPEMLEHMFMESKTLDQFVNKIKGMKWVIDIEGYDYFCMVLSRI